MTSKVPKPISAAEDKAYAVFRRLLLAKQLYKHGLEHSNYGGALNKMIAVHNFHNAIEIILKAIMLHYDIKSENQLDIKFGEMIKAINKHSLFQEKDITLPYRQEISTLNQYRNLVQHHGFEPESNSMDSWRVYTRDFLIQSCQNYFKRSFDDLSPVDLIEDWQLKALLRLSFSVLDENNMAKSAMLSKIAFEWARKAIFGTLPEEDRTYLVVPSDCKIRRNIINVFKKIDEKANDTLYFSALLSSGIKLVDYKRFRTITPPVAFAGGGTVYCYCSKELSVEDARWALDFVVNAIIYWQTLGLEPSVPEKCKKEMQKIIDERGANLDK